jgi:hypothetical protein
VYQRPADHEPARQSAHVRGHVDSLLAEAEGEVVANEEDRAEEERAQGLAGKSGALPQEERS